MLSPPGSELHFPSVQPSDAGVYICTCRNLHHANTSRAELLVTGEFLLLPFLRLPSGAGLQTADPGSWFIHLPERMVVAWMRVLAMEVKRGNRVKTDFRAEL